MKTKNQEIVYLGQMLTASTKKDKSRIGAIIKRLGQILICVMLTVLAGCSTIHVVTPSGWDVAIDRGLISTNFDLCTIAVDPNGMARLELRKYQSDASKAMELADNIIKTAIVGTAATATVQ